MPCRKFRSRSLTFGVPLVDERLGENDVPAGFCQRRRVAHSRLGWTGADLHLDPEFTPPLQFRLAVKRMSASRSSASALSAGSGTLVPTLAPVQETRRDARQKP